MIQQIVVGVDGSDSSLAAWDQALNLAEKLSASMKGVFVIDIRKTQVPLVYAGGSYEVTFERIYIPPDPSLREFYQKISEDLRDFAVKCMDACVGRAKERGIPAEYTIEEGYPSEILREEARSGGMIVVGQLGENAEYRRTIVGSTTEDLVRMSPRPVLMATRDVRDIKRVLFPYDGSRTAEGALQLYINAMKGLAEEFIMLRIGEDEDDRCCEREMDYLTKHEIPFRVVNRKGAPLNCVLEVAEEEKVDMILVGSHGKNKIKDYILGSTTTHLIRKSPVPLLIVY
jgi:nucleotide-binding universal stress UspA family protein